jgi:predicted peroxiredoxin
MTRYRNLLVAAVFVVAVASGWMASHLASGQVRLATEKPVADKGTLVINLTSGKEDPHKATMAMQLAGHGLADGRKVVVFLNVRATDLASKQAPAAWVFGKNPPLPDMLKDLIKREAVVMVCPHCMEALGTKKEDLVDGAQVASRESLFGSLGSNCAVFSY